MDITVNVKLRSSNIELIKVSDARYTVRLTAPPEKGKANSQLIEIMARHFGVAKSRVTIVRGAASREKILRIIR